MPGTVETQQLRIKAPVGVSIFVISKCRLLIFLQSAIRLRLRIAFTVAGQAVSEQVDFSGFPAGLTG